MRTAIYLLAALLVFGVSLAKLRGTPARPGIDHFSIADCPELSDLQSALQRPFNGCAGLGSRSYDR